MKSILNFLGRNFEIGQVYKLGELPIGSLTLWKNGHKTYEDAKRSVHGIWMITDHYKKYGVVLGRYYENEFPKSGYSTSGTPVYYAGSDQVTEQMKIEDEEFSVRFDHDPWTQD